MGAALSTVFIKRNEVAYRDLAVISPKQGEAASSDIQDWANSVARQVDDSGCRRCLLRRRFKHLRFKAG